MAESALYNAELGEEMDGRESQRSSYYIKTNPSFAISNNVVSPCVNIIKNQESHSPVDWWEMLEDVSNSRTWSIILMCSGGARRAEPPLSVISLRMKFQGKISVLRNEKDLFWIQSTLLHLPGVNLSYPKLNYGNSSLILNLLCGSLQTQSLLFLANFSRV